MKKVLLLQDLLESKLEFMVKFKNLTSDTKLEKPVNMLEIMDDGCSIEVPARCCAVAHQILLCITITSDKPSKKSKTKDIEAVGKVVTMESIDDKRFEVTINFNQYVKEEWKFLTQYLQARQDSINELTENLKKMG